MKLDQQSRDFLFDYLNNNSPTGYEASGQRIWSKYLTPYVDEIRSDNYGTCYGVINPEKPFRVVIEAHADEISWYVNYITDDGFLHVIRNGGSDHTIATSKRVDIHTKNGLVKGIFGWPAIHTRKGKDMDMAPTLDKIFIDIGAADKEDALRMGVHVGCIVTYPDELIELGDNYLVGRALDNRMGGFCIAQVARKLHENKDQLPFALYVVNAVQEEVGLRGAEMITETIKPHVAIVTDVTHDTHTPLIESKKHGDVHSGKGPSITYAPAVHNILRELVMDTGDKNNIAFQREASSRVTGTDTDAFAYSNGGVPSVLISLPLRYMHTTVEMAHKSDIEGVINLIYESLKVITPETNFNYLK